MAITRIRESEEMYLETILLLHRTLSNVRAVDVGEELGYAKSSVSRGVNLLKDKGYIDIDPATGNITFTRAGKEKAEEFTSVTVSLRPHSGRWGQKSTSPRKMPAASNTSFRTR